MFLVFHLQQHHPQNTQSQYFPQNNKRIREKAISTEQTHPITGVGITIL